MSRVVWSWARIGALAVSCFACAKIVGITDTNVTRDDALGADMSPAQGGGAGAGAVVVQPGAAGTGSASAGAGGVGGSSAQPGLAGAGGGSGGMPMTMLGAAGTAPILAACTDQAARCGTAGREVCTAGAWQAQACPPETPTCEGEGQCIVRGPALLPVGGVFLIDATEVTVAQYRQFLTAKNGDVSGQVAACTWNQSYFEEVAFEPDNQPIAMVDWCDAYAYCAWAGKRMCGRVGGGPTTTTELQDPTLNQWYLACGGPNGNLYSTDDRTGCNLSNGFSNIAPVATYPGCEGYYPGIFDLRGNVWEWIDDCETSTGPDDVCAPMGGSTITNDSANCDYYGDTTGEETWHRSDKILYAGFRCCAG
ncbi:MAG: hypothetical protein RL033_7223 [Pseudomonadota bacterium]|jgi:formylglycine-generating enzyme